MLKSDFIFRFLPDRANEVSKWICCKHLDLDLLVGHDVHRVGVLITRLVHQLLTAVRVDDLHLVSAGVLLYLQLHDRLLRINVDVEGRNKSLCVSLVLLVAIGSSKLAHGGKHLVPHEVKAATVLEDAVDLRQLLNVTVQAEGNGTVL